MSQLIKNESEVGFEPTPTYVDQNTPIKERDHSWVWRLRPLGHPDISVTKIKQHQISGVLVDYLRPGDATK